MKAASRKGFTLIEILIVVIILGILAAIVIPQFTNASQDAKQNAAASLVQTVRSQLELYKLQMGALPTDLGTDWDELVKQQTNAAGTKCGPYLQEVPKNPLAQTGCDPDKVNVKDLEAADKPADADFAGAGFVFCSKTGRIWISDGSAAGKLFR